MVVEQCSLAMEEFVETAEAAVVVEVAVEAAGELAVPEVVGLVRQA
jgi:hypothetical protein